MLRQLGIRHAAVIGILVAILALENAPRLARAVERTDAPMALLGQLMVTLVPEYLAIAVPVASYLAPALAIRSLSLRGEWQMFGALGLGPARIMLVPIALALAGACAQMAIRMNLEPHSERALDRLYAEISSGRFGTWFEPDMPILLNEQTTLLMDRRSARTGAKGPVLLKHEGEVFSARVASAARERSGHLLLDLQDGVVVRQRGGGHGQVIRFDRLVIRVGSQTPERPSASVRDRLSRIDAYELLGLVSRPKAGEIDPQHAKATLASRLSSAVFCLILPWFALAFGVPPRRNAGGIALLAGVAAIAVFLRTSAFVEERFFAAPLIAAALHVGLWSLLAVGAVRFANHRGA